ncbi:hypothetical protein AVDCRST_MAG81-3770 [uncultured Synechococcales cyanobacterium]|uniref:Uncharacterized protein n=1 Tax=uncultured Synechococcales cyanobacterium TaxID=1936017 RepID=A0A6J4VS31_9CYAN|nr:hypothetical protein AVDCRST_MAG81-3770 [uncultured Synechococcales cyanobacterium]
MYLKVTDPNPLSPIESADETVLSWERKEAILRFLGEAQLISLGPDYQSSRG